LSVRQDRKSTFDLLDGSGKAITFSEWATLAQDRAGWLKLVTKVPFGIRSNDGLSSMQKQTLKSPKSCSIFIHE